MKQNLFLRSAAVAAIIGGVLIFNSFSAVAQNKKPARDLEDQFTVQRVSVKEGKEVLGPGDQAKPGDTLQYTAVYKNLSKGTIRQLKPVIPIPTGTEYLPDTAKPEKVMASADGKKFEPVPLKRKVRQPDGKVHEELVPYAEYKALQWFVNELPSGRSVTLSARVRVTPVGAPAAAAGKKP